MSGENLLKTYPNAAKVVKEWFMNQMIASMDSDNITPEEFKQAMIDEGISDERLGTLIDIQPRTFFDAMDLNDIEINITGDNKNGWDWVYTGRFENRVCKTRREAEINSIQSAFDTLEEKLTGKLNFEQLNKEEENETK